jgi:Mce-associated membrane protein
MPAVDTENRTDATPSDSVEDAQADETTATAPVSDAQEPSDSETPRRLSVSLRAAVLALVIFLLVAGLGVLGWLYLGVRGQLSAQDRAAGDRNHAEDIASDYSLHAAEMDYQDFNAWKLKLVNGTTPELKDKLTQAADSMQQILAPLQWKSTARPLAAKVRSEAGGIYVVDAFVSVLTKTMQAPDGLQSTATYSVTLDSNHNWQITDVGGIDAVLGK